MAKSKKNAKKPSLKVGDMPAKDDPKGGAADIFLKIGDIKGESQLKSARSTVKLNSTIGVTNK